MGISLWSRLNECCTTMVAFILADRVFNKEEDGHTAYSTETMILRWFA